ncbi:MAG: PAS domain-containing protein, partial [Clostridiales bacterium]|nr:PAS domain-containing protein [Clostridiales bacterium]
VSPKTNEFAFDSDYSSELSRELTGMNGSLENLRKLIYPDDYEVFLEQRKEFEKFGAVPFSRRLRIINPDGSYSWVLIRSAVIDRDEFGTPTLIRGALLLLDNATIAEEEQKYIPIISQDSYTREEEKLGSILFSNSPFMSGLFSSDFKPIYFNPTFLKYLGSSNLKESINNFSDIISKRIPAFQPSGARSVPLEDRLMATAKYGHAEFETVLITNTGLTAFSCVMKKITIDDSFIIGVYLSNVQKLKDVEHEILKKDKLLRAINKIVPNILNADQKAFNKELVASLRILGLTINVGRVYMFENLKINGVLHAKKVCEWSTFVSERKDQSKEITICYENFEPVNACLSEKKIYAGASPLMLGRDRKAVYSLIIPLYYRGMSWGFIGFDDCRENHFFSDTERQLLVSGGGFLMGAILRNKTFSEAVAAREMLEAREYMLKEVNKTCMTLFAAGGINNLRSVLPSALKMLAQAMKTARLSIWRNKEKDGTIFTERVFTWRDENLFIESDYPISVSLEIPACINGESFYEINDSINSLAERIKELYTINAPDGSAFIGTLVLNGKFWGFVSYLFLEPERRLDDSEKSLFIQAGLMAAISMSLAETT